MPLLDATRTAQEAYYLANGQYATEFDQLDMQIPKSFTIKLPDSMGGNCWKNGTSVICTNQCYSYLAPWGTQAAIYFRTYAHSSSNTKLCANPKIETVNENGRAKKMSAMIVDLKKAGVINEIRSRQLETWNAIRNSAAHGKIEEFTKEQVAAMLQGVQDFMAQQMK